MRRQIPDHGCSIIATGCKRFAARRQRQRIDARAMPPQTAALAARLEIPQGHEVVVGARCERLAIGGEDEGVNPRRLFVAPGFPLEAC